jgi:hypothetical protein
MAEAPLVLVVDDAPDGRYVYAMYLQHHGRLARHGGRGRRVFAQAVPAA